MNTNILIHVSHNRLAKLPARLGIPELNLAIAGPAAHGFRDEESFVRGEACRAILLWELYRVEERLSGPRIPNANRAIM